MYPMENPEPVEKVVCPMENPEPIPMENPMENPTETPYRRQNPPKKVSLFDHPQENKPFVHWQGGQKNKIAAGMRCFG